MQKQKILATVLLLFTFTVCTSAQNPRMPSQDRDAEKDALYGTFSGAKRVPIAEKQRLAYEAAREYLRKFAEDKDPELGEVQKFVAEYEKVNREQSLFKTYRAKHSLRGAISLTPWL